MNNKILNFLFFFSLLIYLIFPFMSFAGSVVDGVREVKTVHIQLSQAQILSCASSYIDLVPAPGATSYINVIDASGWLDHNGTTYTFSGNLNAFTSSQASARVQVTFGFLNATSDFISLPTVTAIMGSASTGHFINMPLRLGCTSAPTGSGGTYDIDIQYVVVDTASVPVSETGGSSSVVSPLLEYSIIFGILFYVFYSVLKFIIKLLSKLL